MTSMTPATELSIVIPVYNALQETIDCVTSLLQSDAKDCPVYLMDDGSDWAVQESLHSTFANAPNVTIVSHFRNRGYTRNISMGVAQTSTPFVCILNSDTLLPKVWVGPMLSKIASDRHIAGIGPLSNAASYQSIPKVADEVRGGFSENDGLGFDPTERENVNALVNTLGQGLSVDVPILNGFCTIFRRSALDEIGGFDVESYPQGYGEENDLCVRLKAHGYRLSVFLGVFVHHQKSKSFGSDRKKTLSAKGSQTLAKKFGDHYVPALGKQLQTSMPLAKMRTLVSAALENGHDTLSKNETLTKKTRDVSVGASEKARGITLTGGVTYLISPDRIKSISGTETSEIQLSAENDTLTLSLPEGVNLTLVSTSPIVTAFHALGLWSTQQTVYVSGWTPNGATEYREEFLFADWPKTWPLGTTSDISFQYLHISA